MWPGEVRPWHNIRQFETLGPSLIVLNPQQRSQDEVQAQTSSERTLVIGTLWVWVAECLVRLVSFALHVHFLAF